jgi:hypothetical protein
MKTTDISEKNLVVSKIGLNQLFDQITQLKCGLLNTLDALDCIMKRCVELKNEKLEKEIN